MKVIWKSIKILVFFFFLIELPAALLSWALSDGLQNSVFNADELYDVFNALLRLIFLLFYMKRKYGQTRLLVFNNTKPVERIKECIAALGFIGIFLFAAVLIFLIISWFVDTETLLSTQIENIENYHLSFKLLCNALLIPIYEELLFREHLFNETKGLSSQLHCILLLSILFGVLHVNPLQAIHAAFDSICWFYMRVKYEDLWGGLLVHCINNGIVALVSYYSFNINISLLLGFYLLTSAYFVFFVIQNNKQIYTMLCGDKSE